MSNLNFPRWPTRLCFFAAAALHMAVFLSSISIFVLLLSAINLVPFGACLAASRSQGFRLPAFLGSGAALGIDIFMNYQVLVAATATTSPIPLLFGPGINFLFGVIPGAITGFLFVLLWNVLIPSRAPKKPLNK